MRGDGADQLDWRYDVGVELATDLLIRELLCQADNAIAGV
jgi:hypothetical protein